MFEANIEFTAYEDIYKQGENSDCDNLWSVTLTAGTRDELRAKIEEETYSKFEDWDKEQINNYPDRYEYSTSYMTNAENEGQAMQYEMEEWVKGNRRLWSVHCHVLVCEIIRHKVEL